MQKKSIASLELTALVNELQFLVKGKIQQIYHQEKKELLLQLHAPGKGKQLLKIVVGKFLCLTDKKEVPLRPSGFCMQLRKYINNAFIKKLEQKDSERIVVFELEKKEKFFLIVELFSKGNVVLTDSAYKIIGTLERQIWKDRTVKPGEKYIFPASPINWKTTTEKELFALFEKSDKKNVVISLATEVGLGGLYAEEVCKRAGINKNKLPKDIDEKEVRLIVAAIKEFLKFIEKPQGFIYEEQITPFPLFEGKERKGEIKDDKTKKELKKITKTYNEAINTLNPFEVISPFEKKIKMIEKTIAQQEEAIVNLQEKIEINKRKGELIYEKYVPLQKLLEIVKELRKTHEWSEISKELKKEKKITKVDLKWKKVVVDL